MPTRTAGSHIESNGERKRDALGKGDRPLVGRDGQCLVLAALGRIGRQFWGGAHRPHPGGRYGHACQGKASIRVRGGRAGGALGRDIAGRRSSRDHTVDADERPRGLVGRNRVAGDHAEVRPIVLNDKHVALIAAAGEIVVGADKDEALAIMRPGQVIDAQRLCKVRQNAFLASNEAADHHVRGLVLADLDIGQDRQYLWLRWRSRWRGRQSPRWRRRRVSR